uniref:Uncharacterized protein n=1 Tax=Siphoviridae sp. ctBCr48 TaxID=2827802 RepID=A0A8S5SI74_9CAUD|nr:MAG TPA: hypothetical protein [Siphoviridae sp. ctBCr48]
MNGNKVPCGGFELGAGLRINPYTQKVEANVNIGIVRVGWEEDGNLDC